MGRDPPMRGGRDGTRPSRARRITEKCSFGVIEVLERVFGGDVPWLMDMAELRGFVHGEGASRGNRHARAISPEPDPD